MIHYSYDISQKSFATTAALPQAEDYIQVLTQPVQFLEDVIIDEHTDKDWWVLSYSEELPEGKIRGRTPIIHPYDFSSSDSLGDVIIIKYRVFQQIIKTLGEHQFGYKEIKYYLKLHLNYHYSGAVLSDKSYYLVKQTEQQISSFETFVQDMHQDIQSQFNKVFKRFLRDIGHDYQLPFCKVPLPKLPKNPKVTISIRCGDDRGYLLEAINSVAKLDWKNYELILIDNGKEPSQFPVNHLNARWVRCSQQGYSTALNGILGEVDSDLIVQLDDDDMFMPHALDTIIQYMQHNPNIGFATGSYKLINADGSLIDQRPVNHKFNSPDVLLRFEGNGTPKIWRRQVWEYMCGADESVLYGEDYEMGLRAGELTEFGLIPEPIYWYRVHKYQSIGDFNSFGYSFKKKFELKCEVRQHCLARRKQKSQHVSQQIVEQFKQLTLVIMTHNRPRSLQKLLHSLTSHQYKDSLQVIVVDDGSEDQKSNQEVCKDFSSQLSLCYLHQPHKGVSAARNLGLKYTQTPYVCFLADDYLLPRGFGIAALKAFSEYPDLKLCTHNIKVKSWNLLKWAEGSYYQLSLLKLIPGNHLSLSQIFNCALPASRAAIFKRDIFSKVGGFDESMTSAEDVELMQRLRKKNITQLFLPHDFITHDLDRSLLGIFKKRVQYAKDLAKYHSSTPNSVLNIKNDSPVTHSLGIIRKSINKLLTLSTLNIIVVPILYCLLYTFFKNYSAHIKTLKSEES